MNQRKWKLPGAVSPRCEALERAGYTPLLGAVLAGRGITDPEAAARYLDRGAYALSDPYDLEDMDKAVSRIRRALEAGEKITVYGDYDVDGITASCLLRDYLSGLGADCLVYIPDRIDEGYGLNSEAIESMAKSGARLLITVDCGITAVEETEFAKGLGMDIIITDHHECPTELPAAYAVIDPKRPGRGGCESLAGVGVAFKLACALEGDPEGILDRYADLVALGTVADVMPLTGENRALVARGIEKFYRNPRPGLAALLRESGAEERALTASVLGYTLAPRINAAGRLCSTETALELLMCREPESAEELARRLCELNRQRQELELKVWRQAMELLSEAPPEGPIVLSGEDWHPGVVGIAASRLAEEFMLPAIMICMDGDMGKGSCRSCGDFNLFDGLSACSEYLESFGGHACAAGLNIKKERIDGFRQALGQYYRDHPPQETHSTEAELLLEDLSLLTMESVESLELLEPCGAGNPRPVACVKGALVESLTPIGGGRHLRLRLEKRGQSVDGVFFSMTSEALGLREGDAADLCFVPQINEFRGRRSVQLLLSAARPAEDLKACRDILEGKIPEEAPSLSREDLERVWRSLKKMGPVSKLRLSRIIEGEAFGPTGPRRACLCLKIFQELSLLKLKVSGGGLEITLEDTGAKADLEASTLYHKLTKSE